MATEAAPASAPAEAAPAAAPAPTLEEQFNAAYDSVRSWTRTNGDPNNDEKLAMYSLGKQAKVGDCNTDRPGMFDFAGKAKWDAWDAIKGKSKDDAMTEYIAELARQKTVYGEAPASG